MTGAEFTPILTTNRVKHLAGMSRTLKDGGSVKGLTLPQEIQDFYAQKDSPYGQNVRNGVFETAGNNWNITRSHRIKRIGQPENGYSRRPTKIQAIAIDNSVDAFISNVATSFLNDRNYYCVIIRLDHIDKDDPWCTGCNKAEKVLEEAFDGKFIDIEDWDCGATIEMYTEEELLKAVDALTAAFGPEVFFDVNDNRETEG